MGLDLSDRWSEACVVDANGEVVEPFRVRTTEPALARRLGGGRAARSVLEVDTHSPWLSRLLSAHGHEVIAANPRRGSSTGSPSDDRRPLRPPVLKKRKNE